MPTHIELQNELGAVVVCVACVQASYAGPGR